jgi:predicted permease
MSALRRLVLRLVNFILPGRGERQLDREIHAHLTMLEERFQRGGLSREEASRAARRALGGAHRAKELHRDARSFVWLEDARRDVRYAIRTLARTPGFTLLAVLTLALGIGSVTVIYSVIHDILLDPLPYPGSERFVNAAVVDAETGRRRNMLPAAEFLDFQEQSDVFDAVFGTRGESGVLTTGESAELLRVVRVTPNFFDVMGLPPMVGRTLDDRDAAPDAPPVAVLRHRAWVTHFAADREVIGRVIDLDGTLRTIVGVMPPRFTWHAADVWVPGPIRRHAADAVTAPRNFQARLKAGVRLQDAEAQLNVIARRRAQVNPAAYPAHFRVEVVNVIEQVVGDFNGVLYTALAAVGLLLLIACCNVANMLLAKASAREREMTIRAALGAGHGRIVRQVLVESLLLGLAGAAAGVLLAYIGIGALVPFLPQGPLPGEVEFGLDRMALLFTLGLAIAVALLFGIAPALYSTRCDLVEGLKGAGRGLTGTPGRVRHALVVAGIALSLVLVLSAGLLMRSFIALVGVDLGFDPHPILVRHVTFARDAYATPAERQRLYADALQRILAVPGVADAAASTGVPPFGSGYTTELEIAGSPRDPRRTALLQFCTDRYFRTLGLQFRRGQPFADGSGDQRPAQAVISQTLAASYFGSADPIGQEITIMVPTAGTGPPERAGFEIVGVVEDVRNRGPREPPAPHIYLPGPALLSNAAILVRTSLDSGVVAGPIRSAIRATNRHAIVREPGTIEEILGTAVYAQPRFSLIVISLFALAGTLLVAIGVFSVMAYTVSRQTREIAVRMALGASRGHVMRIVLRFGGQLLLMGVAAGLISSFTTSRLLARQLWGVSPHDPQTAAAAVALVTLVALLACYLPAHRAIRIDPMAALRQD